MTITEIAERDLEAIGDFIATDNPARALSFLRELRTLCIAIGHQPMGFPMVERYHHLGVRRRACPGYLIFYRVTETVEILHVVQGSRDIDALLFPTP